MEANGVFGMSAITAITAQNTREVVTAMGLPLDLIRAQIDAVAGDLPIGAVKTGMLSSIEIIETVAERIRARKLGPLVVDPVMISKSGYPLLADDAVDAVRSLMLPLADIATPNAHEAERLTGYHVTTVREAEKAARDIAQMGPKAVLVKGGHLADTEEAVDILFDGSEIHHFRGQRHDTPHTHGTGCTYAAAIAARLARGEDLHTAVTRANAYVNNAIRHALPLGHGHGPTNHFYFLPADPAV